MSNIVLQILIKIDRPSMMGKLYRKGNVKNTCWFFYRIDSSAQIEIFAYPNLSKKEGKKRDGNRVTLSNGR